MGDRIGASGADVHIGDGRDRGRGNLKSLVWAEVQALTLTPYTGDAKGPTQSRAMRTCRRRTQASSPHSAHDNWRLLGDLWVSEDVLTNGDIIRSCSGRMNGPTVAHAMPGSGGDRRPHSQLVTASRPKELPQEMQRRVLAGSGKIGS